MIYDDVQRAKRLPGSERSLLSWIISEICVDGKPMKDEDAIKRLIQLKKNSNKNIALYERNGKLEQAIEDEKLFIGLVDLFLPKAATQKDIENELDVLGIPKTMKSMGPLMKSLKSKFSVVDGNLVKSILTE